MYRLFLGGELHGEEVKMAKEYGEIAENRVIPFLKELSQIFRESKIEQFEEFINGNEDKIVEVVKRYYR